LVTSYSQRLDILFRQLHEEAVASPPAPAVTIDAADEPLAVIGRSRSAPCGALEDAEIEPQRQEAGGEA
jgi:hypothetical protein